MTAKLLFTFLALALPAVENVCVVPGQGSSRENRPNWKAGLDGE
jgi:hypothetical protein